MITRAYIEQQIDQFHYRVRMPIFDKVEESPQHTRFEELAIATVCVPKGLNNSLSIGDVVIVGFEDNSASKPIILGQLYREDVLTDFQLYLHTSNINVNDKALLPYNTTIGNISFSQIFNIAQQVPGLITQIEQLQAKVVSLENANKSK